MGTFVLSKQKVVRKMMVTRRGEVKTDQVRLPDNAMQITSVSVSTQLLTAKVTGTIKVFYGVSVNESLTGVQVAALTQGTLTNSAVGFTAIPGLTEYIYYAHPVGLSFPTFTYGGFQGGFLNLGTVSVTVDGSAQTYRVWRSTNVNLGSVTLNVTH